jgi:hypothetical protein
MLQQVLAMAEATHQQGWRGMQGWTAACLARVTAAGAWQQARVKTQVSCVL